MLIVCMVVLTALLAIGIVAIILDDSQEVCNDICLSNEATFYNYRDGGYQNPVCYCKDKEDRIFTVVM